MTQIVVTLENGADTNFIRRMIENMRGVLNASVHRVTASDSTDVSDDWLDMLHSIKDSVDTSVIDKDDDRTNYIMSK